MTGAPGELAEPADLAEPDGLVTTGLTFPAGFGWGATTSAYQVEGAVDTDGRGPSTWDAFCQRPGRIAGGHTGEQATDHYHRYRDDIDVMTTLGLGMYRFSVSWPRVLPEGTGAVNQRGLAFYDRLADALLEHGITPWATLHHWDLPQALQERGGWADRRTAEVFADYAGVVYQRLGDRVRHWTTVNEPWVQAYLGHAAGIHAPGITDGAVAVRVAHHLLLGHGRAVRAIRAMRGNRPNPELSIVLNVEPVSPAVPDDPADQDAARRVDGLLNRFWLDALFHAHYPADLRGDLAGVTDWSFVHDGDLGIAATPIDALGVNYYRRQVVGATDAANGAAEWPGSPFVRAVPTGRPRTGMGWEIDATGLTDLLLRLHHDYPEVPLYVTENGAAFPDEITADGRVPDPDRVAYLEQHVRAAHAAVAAGVDLRGYFVWSLLDNFEWAEGYDMRFGIVHVDFGTRNRIIKDSGWWYRGVISRNGLPGTPDGSPGDSRARPSSAVRAF